LSRYGKNCGLVGFDSSGCGGYSEDVAIVLADADADADADAGAAVEVVQRLQVGNNRAPHLVSANFPVRCTDAHEDTDVADADLAPVVSIVVAAETEGMWDEDGTRPPTKTISRNHQLGYPQKRSTLFSAFVVPFPPSSRLEVSGYYNGCVLYSSSSLSCFLCVYRVSVIVSQPRSQILPMY